MRSGYALKRLDASEGRAALGAARTSHTGTFLRLSDNDAWLFELLDGTHSLVELVGLCRAALRRRPGRRGWRGCCRTSASAGSSQGVAGGTAAGRGADGPFWRKLFKPREKVFTGLGPRIEALYRARRLGALHAPGRCIALAALVVAGLAAFVVR